VGARNILPLEIWFKKRLHSLVWLKITMKTKRAIVVISLVKESIEKTNEQIEKEILRELKNEMPIIQWIDSVKKVIVIEEHTRIRKSNETYVNL
jgi:hypothetical protein